MDNQDSTEAQDGWGASCGSGGEFFQGQVGGIWLQVACPVDRWRWARISPGADEQGPGPDQAHPLPPKAKELHERFAQAGMIVDGGGETRVGLGGDDLRPGTGLGSSTADLGALIGAVHGLAGRVGVGVAGEHGVGSSGGCGGDLTGDVDPRRATAWALKVEPTNGTFFRDLTLFDHRGGDVAESMGPVPVLDLVVVTDGPVDTLAFNRRLDRRVAKTGLASGLLRRWTSSLGLLRHAVASGDLEALGRASTLSARCSVTLTPRPLLEPVERVAGEMGALGVMVGHSGTATGILLDPGRRTHPEDAAARLQSLIPGSKPLLMRTGPGGIRWGTVSRDAPLPPYRLAHMV